MLQDLQKHPDWPDNHCVRDSHITCDRHCPGECLSKERFGFRDGIGIGKLQQNDTCNCDNSSNFISGLFRTKKVDDRNGRSFHNIFRIVGRHLFAYSAECKKCEEICGGYRESLMSDGQLTPSTGMFWQKNFDGLRDQTEHIVTPGDPLGEMRSKREIAEKYADIIME